MSGPRGYARHDGYAASRCPRCKHLRYADMKPGDPCLAAVVYPDGPRCNCTDEHYPEASGGDAA